MSKRETFQLLSIIAVFYEQFTVDQKKVDLWHEVLKNDSFENLQQRLFVFVKGSPYPPKISDLIPKDPRSAQNIPDKDETRILVKQTPVPASPEVAERYLAEMRKILGIERCKADEQL